MIDELGDVSWTTVALSAATLAVLLGLGKVVPQVPAPLVGGRPRHPCRRRAVARRTRSGPHRPRADGTTAARRTVVRPRGALAPGAFAIAIMCFLETASVAGAVRRANEPPIDNDQELAANSLACIAGSFFRAMPSAGGFSQTAINQRSGAVTQLSELVTAMLAVACALFLGGVLSDLPQATLGAMVVVAVTGLIDPAEFVRFWRLDRIEFWVAVITAGSGLVFGLLAAVLIGVLLTLLLVLHELNNVGVTELQPTPDGHDVQLAGPDTAAVPGLLVLRYDGPLYTANVRNAHRRVIEAVDARHPDIVVVDVSTVAVLSVTVLDQFADLEREVGRLGTTLWVANLPPRARATAVLTGRWDELQAAGRLYPTALAATRAYLARHP